LISHVFLIIQLIRGPLQFFFDGLQSKLDKELGENYGKSSKIKKRFNFLGVFIDILLYVCLAFQIFLSVNLQ